MSDRAWWTIVGCIAVLAIVFGVFLETDLGTAAELFKELFNYVMGGQP